MNNRLKGALGIASLAIPITIAACGPTHSGTSGLAHGSGLASIPGATQAEANYKAIAAKCGLTTASGQIAAARQIKSKAGRQALLVKCGVPASKVPDAETKALDAAEHAHLLTRSGRETYFSVTLPRIIVAEQS